MVRNIENVMVQEFKNGKWESRAQAIYEGTREERLAMPTDMLNKEDIFWEYGGEDGSTAGEAVVLHWNGTAWA